MMRLLLPPRVMARIKRNEVIVYIDIHENVNNSESVRILLRRKHHKNTHHRDNTTMHHGGVCRVTVCPHSRYNTC